MMNAVDDRIRRSQGGRLCPLLLEQNIVCLNTVQIEAVERVCVVGLSSLMFRWRHRTT